MSYLLTPSLQKIGGFAALALAAIYVAAFVYYGAVVQYPSLADAAEKIAYLTSHSASLYVATLVGYVLFGVILALLLLVLHEKLNQQRSLLTRLSSLFGGIWVGLVLAAGMISNVGLQAVTSGAIADPHHALQLWQSISYVVNGLGGGNEIVGALWVLLLSYSALRNKALPNALGYFGVSVGVIGVLTILPIDGLTDAFGVSQLMWFGWLGVVLLRQAPQANPSTLHR